MAKVIFNNSDFASAEIQRIALFKRATQLASDTLHPVLLLSRELFQMPYNDKFECRFILYLKSPYDSHFLKLKQFQSLELFCVWFLSKHPYKEFTLLNYSEI